MTSSEKEVRDWFAREVEKLESEDCKLDWLTLREAINDKALMSITDDLFVAHLKIMYLQLLRKCSTKLCSGGLEAMMRDPESYMARMDAVNEPMSILIGRVYNGEYLNNLYSDAWGSSPNNAVKAMLFCFQTTALSGRMAEQTIEALNRQICAAFVAYETASIEAHNKGKGGNGGKQRSVGDAGHRSPSGTPGNGCLILIVAGVALLGGIGHLLCMSNV